VAQLLDLVNQCGKLRRTRRGGLRGGLFGLVGRVHCLVNAGAQGRKLGVVIGAHGAGLVQIGCKALDSQEEFSDFHVRTRKG